MDTTGYVRDAPRRFSMTMVGHPPNDNLTRRMNHHAKGELVKQWRRDAAWLAKTLGSRVKPFARARVTFHFTFKQNRRQGLDAYVGACKPILDGLVDAGLIMDDGFTVVTELWAWADLGTESLVEITVEELT